MQSPLAGDCIFVFESSTDMMGTIARMKQRLGFLFPRVTRIGRSILSVRRKYSISLLVIAHTLGALTSIQAIMSTRTSQGAIAWAISLNTIPYIAVPAYWVFGSSRFDGYVDQRRKNEAQGIPIVDQFVQEATEGGFIATTPSTNDALVTRLTRIPTTRGNSVKLLRDGDAIFSSILDGIDQAEEYVLVQYYIVRDDDLGRRLKRHLLEAVARGVKVRFIYDEIGSTGLPDSYVKELRDAGAEVFAFNQRSGLTNRFQLNFRNHRKIVVADGRSTWVGGANIGDEYTSGFKKAPNLHDTIVKVTGPAVQSVQVSFSEDWLWASGETLDLEWSPRKAPGGDDVTVRCVPSGPADRLETFTLYVLHLIQSSKSRLWISTPYFVPDEQIVSALKLASMRGVDVRILIPDKSDSQMVDLSGWAHVERLLDCGVEFHRHAPGFLHQKVILIDSDLATVGTANFDNRSFRLNFEITMEIRDPTFAAEVAAMLEKDFGNSRLVAKGELAERGFLFSFGVRSSSLLAPIQ